VVLFKPFLGLNKGVMSKLFQDLQSGSSNLFCQFFSVFEDDLGFGGNDWHNILHDDLNLGFDWGNNFIDFVLELVKLLGDFVSKVLASFLHFFNGIVNGLTNLAPEVCPSIVGGQSIRGGQGIFDQLGQLLSQEFEKQFLNKLMVFREPFLGFNQSIMAQLFQDFKNGRSDLFGEFTSIMNDDFSFGSNLGHDISENDLNLGLDGSNDGIDFVLQLIEFLRDFISKLFTSGFHFVNGILNSISNFFPKVGPAIFSNRI